MTRALTANRACRPLSELVAGLSFLLRIHSASVFHDPCSFPLISCKVSVDSDANAQS